MKQFKSTSTLCETYDLSPEYFTRRIKSGEFVQDEHYIKKGSLIRWNIEAIEQWFSASPTTLNKDTEDILNRVLQNTG